MFGLYQATGAAEPRGGWAWVTGEPMGYANFGPGNPDNFQGNQNYGRYFSGSKGHKPTDYWDDTTASWSSNRGYVYEID
jgi:hypothetical protein